MTNLLNRSECLLSVLFVVILVLGMQTGQSESACFIMTCEEGTIECAKQKGSLVKADKNLCQCCIDPPKPFMALNAGAAASASIPKPV